MTSEQDDNSHGHYDGRFNSRGRNNRSNGSGYSSNDYNSNDDFGLRHNDRDFSQGGSGTSGGRGYINESDIYEDEISKDPADYRGNYRGYSRDHEQDSYRHPYWDQRNESNYDAGRNGTENYDRVSSGRGSDGIRHSWHLWTDENNPSDHYENYGRRDQQNRNRFESASDRMGDTWRNRSGRDNNYDYNSRNNYRNGEREGGRNFFERAGDRIRETRNNWGHRDEQSELADDYYNGEDRYRRNHDYDDRRHNSSPESDRRQKARTYAGTQHMRREEFDW